MSKPSDDACQQLAAAIEAYLTVHPAAADSAQGVADWWIGEMGVRASVPDVRAALEVLVKRGVVEAQVMVDGRKVYRAHHQPKRVH